ncbi:MAG: hypothetical protein HY329_23315 [Chloroflexi bacterium]|nr:hypothetical protein [Chloroflexota bacterium]
MNSTRNAPSPLTIPAFIVAILLLFATFWIATDLASEAALNEGAQIEHRLSISSGQQADYASQPATLLSPVHSGLGSSTSSDAGLSSFSR